MLELFIISDKRKGKVNIEGVGSAGCGLAVRRSTGKLTGGSNPHRLSRLPKLWFIDTDFEWDFVPL